MPVSERMVLLVRAVCVFAVNAFLGLVVSAITYARGPRPARGRPTRPPSRSPFGLAAADDRGLRPHPRRRGHRQVGAAPARPPGSSPGWPPCSSAARRAAHFTAAVTDSSTYLPYLAVAACAIVVVGYATRSATRDLVNIELTNVTRSFGKNRAVDGVSLRGRARRPRPARPERRGQDLPAAHARAPCCRRPPARSGCWTGTRARRRAPRDPPPPRLPAAEPRLLPGVHRRGVRRVLRAAQGDAAGPRAQGRGDRRRAGRPRRQGQGAGCARCPAACCAGSASRRRS